MSISSAIRREVETRAGHRCEYCRMHQSLQGGLFHVEHIVPTAQDGSSDLSNLALACPGCNLHKSDRVLVFDEETATRVRLFNPRTESWHDHFRWVGYEIAGLTPAGRATVVALKLNHPRRIKIRKAEEWFKLFPPTDRGS
jgi:5-methylcytosine-specific restriction endonuclease McrA